MPDQTSQSLTVFIPVSTGDALRPVDATQQEVDILHIPAQGSAAGFRVSQVSPTFNLAQEFEPADAVTTMPSMGGWDNKSMNLGRRLDSFDGVPCSEAMAFRALLDEANSNGGSVYMEPSGTIGVAVDYWC
ncbi:hypothetical protein DL771_007560 [Monosporascus sp. 5C6A]|nr:hypothetical protein DL771_007560 [Monosporascus sp. 5C6A]